MPKYLNRILALVVVIVFYFCGVFEVFSGWGMSKPVQVSFVILLIGATLWITEAIPLFVTSLLILFLGKTWLLGVLREGGVKISETVFLGPFFSNIILLFLGGFVISSALHRYKIDEDLARRIITKTGNSIPMMIAGIMGITAFLSMWLSNTATAAMMLALCIPIINSLPADDRYRKAILLSIPFSANIGGMGTPIGTPPNAIAIQYMQKAGIAPSFLKWMILGVPSVIGMLVIMWFVIMFFFRGTSKGIVQEFKPLKTVYSRRAKLVIAISLVTVALWITEPIHKLSSGTVALIPVLLFFGVGFLKINDLRALSWDVLLIMGGGLCLGEIISAGGLSNWLVARLPVDQGSFFMLAVVLGVVSCFMSTLMSNTATANLIMPIVMGMGLSQVSPVLVGVAFSCSLAMSLPISTPPNALAFSTGEISVKDMLRPGLIGTIIGIVLTFTAGWWWWKIIGLY
ncbi:MAG: SLC13 family permease [Candidatus Eisenbacteria bacterium]|nr:SLC13 family permease [Candidatus Eisenbacteria bacterium]